MFMVMVVLQYHNAYTNIYWRNGFAVWKYLNIYAHSYIRQACSHWPLPPPPPTRWFSLYAHIQPKVNNVCSSSGGGGGHNCPEQDDTESGSEKKKTRCTTHTNTDARALSAANAVGAHTHTHTLTRINNILYKYIRARAHTQKILRTYIYINNILCINLYSL